MIDTHLHMFEHNKSTIFLSHLKWGEIEICTFRRKEDGCDLQCYTVKYFQSYLFDSMEMPGGSMEQTPVKRKSKLRNIDPKLTEKWIVEVQLFWLIFIALQYPNSNPFSLMTREGEHRSIFSSFVKKRWSLHIIFIIEEWKIWKK